MRTLKREMAEIRQKRASTEDEVRDLDSRRDDLDAGQRERMERQLSHMINLDNRHKDLHAEWEGLMTDAIVDGEMTVKEGIPDRSAQQAYGRHSTSVGLRSLDAMHEKLPSDRQDDMERCIRNSPTFSEEFAAHADPAYERAFTKLLMNGEQRGFLAMDGPERDAMARAIQSRSPMAEGATTTGGYGVPVQIDPSILMTGQGSGNPVFDLARKVDVVTNVFKPVNSAGVTWSFDAEAQEVSDDSPTLGQPSITVFMARGFVPFSIEVQSDYAGFQAEMARLLSEGYSELLADKLARGVGGTTEPQGYTTALVAAGATSQVVVTTDGSFGDVDLYKVWKALGQRFRSNASWIMSADVNNRIRQFGSATPNYHASTVQLPAGAADVLFGRPAYISPYFPDFTGTTGAANILTVGDLSQGYTVARRAGMSIELAPLLFGSSNRYPTGQRGFFAWGRIGAGSVVDAASRILVNT
jgi:HK97 family phage major capsid protein